MKQEFNGPVEGGVAGHDIIHGDVHNHFNAETLNLHLSTPAKPRIKIVVPTGPEHLTEDQKARLKEQVAEVIRLEGLLKRTPKSFASVWVAVNAKCRASSYHLITQANFPKAEKFLREWIGRLSSAKSAPKKDANWRNRKYSYIFTNVRQLDAQHILRERLQDKHGTDSLKGLSDDDLEDIYRLIAGWKKAGHAPGQAQPE